MAYLNQYQYSYKQKIGSSAQTVQVTLFQKSSEGTGTPLITQLVGSKPAFRVNVIDNDKDKFREVRGKQATLLFKPQTGITASTFSSGPDDEWIVEAVVVSTGFVLFKGFLVMDDHQQSFLPVSHNYDIELTATDNLGTLKEVPLTDDSGAYIRGYKKIIDIIAQALRKTGLQLDIIVRDSWMEESQTAFGPACNLTYLQMKTFEKDINEAVDCYTALEIIFSKRLSIKQYNGTWWIENIDEKTTNQAYLFRFDYTGTYVGQEPLAYYIEAIGKNEEIKLLNKDAILSYTRPIKYGKLTYKYDLPKEIIDNMDFSRGAVNGSITVPTGYVAYDLDDWVKKTGSRPNFWSSPTTGTQDVYIERKFENGYEKERFMVIDKPSYSYSTELVWIQNSEGVPVGVNDKLVVSLDWATFSDLTGTGTSYVGMYVILAGDDGTDYIFWGNGLHHAGSRWWPMSVVSFPDDRQAIYSEFVRNDTNETEWQTMSGELEPIPVAGNLYFLIALPEIPGVTKMKFANFQVEYLAYINGSYQKYSGHSFKIEQAGNYKANIDDNVSISDSPRKLFKGAMFKLVAGKYVLTERWFAGGDLLRQGLVPPYPPDAIYLHPFGWLQIYALWNQYNRRMIELSGSATGLKLGDMPPDLIDTYQVVATTDAGTEVTTEKEFMLVGMEQDYQEGQWNLSLAETYDSTIGKDFTTPLTFKYES
jgi:hypothetical protein